MIAFVQVSNQWMNKSFLIENDFFLYLKTVLLIEIYVILKKKSLLRNPYSKIECSGETFLCDYLCLSWCGVYSCISTRRKKGKIERMTSMGFEPTPTKTGA